MIKQNRRRKAVIQVPYTNVYTYSDLTRDIINFKQLHRDIPVFSIGQSRAGHDLHAIKLGRGSKKIFYNGCHHGMEWLTAKVLFCFARDLAEGLYDADAIFSSTCLYVVPMVNPDGVDIAAGGSPWQANACGVDLNHNYDAMWQLSKSLEEKNGILSPGPTRWGGEYPESEPESRAVANFTRQNRFDMVMALHSQGEVIYYDFCGYVPQGTEEYLQRFESVSRYRRDLPKGISAYGGYKDWFIKTYKKPGFTLEIGLGKNPLPIEDFEEVYSGVVGILREGLR